MDSHFGFPFWIPIPDSHRHSYSGFTYPFQFWIPIPFPDFHFLSHSGFLFPFRIYIPIPDSQCHSHSGFIYPFPFRFNIPISILDSDSLSRFHCLSHSGFLFLFWIHIPNPDFHSHSRFPFPFRISIPIQTQVCEFNAVQVRCLKFKLHAKVQCLFRVKVTCQSSMSFEFIKKVQSYASTELVPGALPGLKKTLQN